VHRMDQAIGDLVSGLKERGVLENTLILFMSDNGGNAEAGPNGRSDGDPTKAASNWFCGESWAFLQNTPFRKYKHYNHEGGISSPLIAHWPAGIDAKNELRHTPSHLIDIMATCVDVGGASYPKENDGHAITPMQGHTLTTVFNGTGIMSRYLFWEHEGNAAVRLGDMKLVRTGRNGPWELNDLKTDRTEQHDLAAAQPEKVTELATEWQKWAERSQVLPYPGEGQERKRREKGKRRRSESRRAGNSDCHLADGKDHQRITPSLTCLRFFDIKPRFHEIHLPYPRESHCGSTSPDIL